jgi:hypothetical protein
MNDSSRCARFAAGWLLLLALTTLPAARAMGQEPEGREAPRYFGGHQFIPSTIVADPFVATSFTSTTGFGMAIGLEVPILNIDGEQIGELEGDIGFLLLEFGYQQRLNNWLALRANVSAAARVGTSTEAILAEGISAVYGYGLGGTASLWRKQSWQLSATADFRGNSLTGIAPLDFAAAVKHAVEAGDTAAIEAAKDSLLSEADNMRVLGGLRGAYTPAPWIGFVGFVEAGLGERFEQGEDNTSVVNFGAAASFNLDPLARVPIGLLGSFRSESLSEKGEDIGGDVQSVGFGVFYTGRRFFSVGLEATWQRVDQRQSDKKVDVTQARLVLRYDF